MTRLSCIDMDTGAMVQLEFGDDQYCLHMGAKLYVAHEDFEDGVITIVIKSYEDS